ncbi:MAG: hypothetical protein MJ090_03495 [Clostridia bacterium]|nr:hypothetical protein [Clostridia bacterium]
MKKIVISDVTLGNATAQSKYSFTFRKKIEVAEILDKIGVSVMLGKLSNNIEDTLLIKSVAGVLSNATLGVCVGFSEEEIVSVWNALKNAKHPRLQILAALSTARMEYVYHKKAPQMLETIKSSIEKCKELCGDVEFIAEDATRADFDYLCEAIKTAINAGASTVTVCDTAGVMLPDEFAKFIKNLYENIENLNDVALGISCSNSLNIADAEAFAAIQNGATEIKTSAVLKDGVSLSGIANLLISKGNDLGLDFSISTTDIFGNIEKIKKLGKEISDGKSPFENGVRSYSDDEYYNKNAALEDLANIANVLGYDLDESDKVRIFNSFKKTAARKGRVGIAEIESIIASEAMQVPPTYTLENFVVTTGNAIDILAHVKLNKNGQLLDGLSVGDGPIDAAFLAIENITGHHYELDDFQIKSITEGREAMGQTIVKLRSRGKVYSGIGTSTDIIGSGVAAYINALNKIIYEEENL